MDRKSILWTSVAVAGLSALSFQIYDRYRHDITSYLSTDTTYCYTGIQTLVDEQGEANCLSFSRSTGLITKVFREDSSSPSTSSHERQAGYAIPGLWDGHGHLLQYGEFLNSVDLFGSKSLQDVRNRILRYLEEHPSAGKKERWIRGVGWDQMALGAMPTAEELSSGEERLKGLYIMLDRVDVHCTWVSRAVLDLLPDDIPDVPGGEVVRDPGMGVFCDNSMELVLALWPKPDKTENAKFVRSAMKRLNQVGIVGMHDAGATETNLALFREMAAKDSDWTVRVYSMVECCERNTFCPQEVSTYDSGDGFLAIKSVKLFADGALGSWGSALIEPYSDRPETSGSLLVNASQLTSVATSWALEGYQVNIHAIGDLANRNAINAMTAALEAVCPGISLTQCQSQRRFRIEHAQIIHPKDQERIHRLGIIPSIQPTHATSDMTYAEKRLGPERTHTEAYRMRSLLDVEPVLGSDFPVEPSDPFQGIYAAVTRKSPRTGRGRQESPDGWYATEALTLDQALRGFTKGPARGGFMEDKAGVIRPGAFADWVILDHPLNETRVEELRALRVMETWVGGRRVYKRSE